MGVGVSPTPRPPLPSGKTWHPLYRRLRGPQGWSGQVRKNLALTGIRSPDRPARSQLLYPLSYLARISYVIGKKKWIPLFVVVLSDVSNYDHRHCIVQLIEEHSVQRALAVDLGGASNPKSRRAVTGINCMHMSSLREADDFSASVYLLTYLRTYSLHGAESFLRS